MNPERERWKIEKEKRRESEFLGDERELRASSHRITRWMFLGREL